MKKFNVGIIGLGIGEQHLIGFLNSRLVNSISICDKDNVFFLYEDEELKS